MKTLKKITLAAVCCALLAATNALADEDRSAGDGTLPLGSSRKMQLLPDYPAE